MITPTAFADSAAFRAGQEHMQRHIGELIRQRRALVYQLPEHHSGMLAIASELDLIIRAVDAISTGGPC